MILADDDYLTIARLMKEDREKVLFYIQKEDTKVGKRFAKEYKFPQWSYSFYTVPDSRNTYLIWFYALNKKEVIDNYFWNGSCLLLNSSDGKRYAYCLRPQKDVDTAEKFDSIQIYSGHFFSRYKERMKLPASLNEYEVMTTFFGRNILYFYGLKSDKVMKKPEKYKDAMAYKIDDGVIFGSEQWLPYKNGQLLVMNNKTFLSNDILKENQKENMPSQRDARDTVMDSIFRDKVFKSLKIKR